MAGLLKAAGFVLPVANDPSGATLNLSRKDLARKLQELRKMEETTIQKAELAFFFYAGHGGQVGSEAYLLGTDAILEESYIESDLIKYGLPLRACAMDLKPRGQSGGLIAIMDACLSGPAGAGTPVILDDAVLAAFSTSAGKVAPENKEGSFYTQAFVRCLEGGGSVHEAIQQATQASALLGKTPDAKYNPNSRLASLRLVTAPAKVEPRLVNNPPVLVQPGVPRPVFKAPPPPPVAVQEPGMVQVPGSSPPPAQGELSAWLYLTPEVEKGLVLRTDHDLAADAFGDLLPRADGGPVAPCFPSRVWTDGERRWIPVRCWGWAIARKPATDKLFLMPGQDGHEVLGERLRVRHAPSINSPTIFTLDPKARVQVISKPVEADGYEWCQVFLEAWVSLAGSRGRTYATYR
jgi:hypothetical protein